MKKNYFMVLIALMAFAMNANAQDATGQNETNNRMTVKMNDGTSFILNTDNVAEITFGDGQPAFSAQNIAKALAALDELGQYVNRLEALEQSDDKLFNCIYSLENHVAALEATATETQTRIYENRDLIHQVAQETAALDGRLAAQENDIVALKTAFNALRDLSAYQDNKINQLQADNDALNATLELESDKIYYQEAKIAALNAYVNTLANEINALKAQVDAMQQ